MMQDNLRIQILELTQARDIARIELIQPLWNHYGTLSRVFLNGSSYASIIVKHILIPTQESHPKGFIGSLSKQRKIRSYEVESHWYLQYNQQVNSGSPTPKCLGVITGDYGQCIVLEDLLTLGYTRSLSSASWHTLTIGLKWLAQFHSQFIGSSTEGLWPCGTYWHLATRPEEWANIEGSKLHYFAPLLDARLRTCRFQTIVHGDAKLANFCFLDDLSKVAAVDFQYVGRGCGMRDVAYFVGSCLSQTECEHREADILELYFSELRACLSSKIDPAELEAEWRPLYSVAWADFQRFMLGWSPQHQKLTAYSDTMTNKAVKLISDELLALAQSACLAAGQFIQENRNRLYKISSKGLLSQASDVVTEIDIQAQAIVLDILEPSLKRYDLGLLAEEGDQDESRLHKEAFWTIDPLDGTQYFIEKGVGYATSIALVSKSGKSILGVVYDPVNQDIYQVVRGEGVTLNGEAIRLVNKAVSLSIPIRWFADRSLQSHHYFERYQSAFEIYFMGGAVMNIIQLLTTPNSCYLKSPKPSLGGCAIWDLAAVSLMLEECLGKARLYDGKELPLNRSESLFFNDVGLAFTSADLSLEELFAYVEAVENGSNSLE
jgi:fructose-1,6-bisphosphatase/inositol monophosphatase family enzyme